MNLPVKQFILLEVFEEMRKNSDKIMEYVDGVVFMSPSPSTQHQRISGRLHAGLFHLLEGKECEVFQAPFDIELKKEGIDGNKIVIPDLSVICQKEGLNENRYVGVPSLIIEILSPSNQSHDLVFKLNLYMQFGVNEYWIVNPLLNTIQVYSLDENSQYQQQDVLKDRGTIQSNEVNGFEVKLEDLFKS